MKEAPAASRYTKIALLVGGLLVFGALLTPFILQRLIEGKMREGRDNLGVIVAGLEKLKAQHGGFVSLDPYPDPKGLGVPEQPWAITPCPETCAKGQLESCRHFECVDFRPHGGDAFFAYACTATEDGQAVTCAALGDLDGDGRRSLQVHRILSPEGGAATTPSFGGLAPACPLDAQTKTARCPPDSY